MEVHNWQSSYWYHYRSIIDVLTQISHKLTQWTPRGICNPHTFRRTFASNLHRSGLDVEHIMRLGGWESLDMVLRYARSVKCEESLRLYQEIKSWTFRYFVTSAIKWFLIIPFDKKFSLSMPFHLSWRQRGSRHYANFLYRNILRADRIYGQTAEVRPRFSSGR